MSPHFSQAGPHGMHPVAKVDALCHCLCGSGLYQEWTLPDAVMPVETIGFHLKPVGFFKQNPALDLPRTINTASKLASQCCGVLSANGQNGHANGHTNGHANGHASILAEPRVATVEE